MTRALLYKEFRETLPMAACGLAWMLLVALHAMDYSPLPQLFSRHNQGVIPFLPYSETFGTHLALSAGVFAIALGFWHALGDSWREAHLFLLHRPVERRQVYLVKLAVGFAAYLVCGAAAILLYALWAATPGTHASPFAWSMTVPTWVSWLATSTLYLGAFLSGVRPAAWLGTRLAPLAAAAVIASILAVATQFPLVLSLTIVSAVLLAVHAAFIAAILGTASSRDFA